ncbi:MAG: signal recognition particle protein [Gammaproteobacteria bacterium]|nr:signal recognition particle protein [Gammaproteobacteria bacterium]
MFETLSNRMTDVFSVVRLKGKLTEDNIEQAVKEMKFALLDADVALSVVNEFILKVKSKAIGIRLSTNLSASQTLLKIAQEELTELLGGANTNLDLASQPPVVILMVGLQGVGKTSSVGKLGLLLRERDKKSVMVASTDTRRPAAIEQLRVLAEASKVSFFESEPSNSPKEIAQLALLQAKKEFMDVLIVDTSGRLAVDDEMMNEIKEIHSILTPKETLFVVDALIGQDAAISAKRFNDVLALTGLILSKVDGDSRGGAALSAKAVTGKPIKFIGTGESLQSIDYFHPERISSRILGQGDVLTLIEEAGRKVDKKKADRLASKLKKSGRFDLEDFRDQIQQMNNMGGLANMLEKLPMGGRLKETAQEKIKNNRFGQMEVIINSMTPKERHFPDNINGSRKKRIAKGSGTTVQDINRLLKQFKQMQKMTKKLGKRGGLASAMKGIGESPFSGSP